MIKKDSTMICISSTAFEAGIIFPSQTAAQAQASMVYELRNYTTLEGRLPALLDRFSGGEIDLFIKHGMASIGYFIPDDEELSKNTLVYVVAHKDREAAAASWSAFGADPTWHTMRDASQEDGRIVSNVVNLFLNPTSFSPVQ